MSTEALKNQKQKQTAWHMPKETFQERGPISSGSKFTFLEGWVVPAVLKIKHREAGGYPKIIASNFVVL